MEIEIREAYGEWAVDIKTPDKIQRKECEL